MTALPPPDPATFRPPVVSTVRAFAPPRPPAPTLPVRAAVGAIVVLTFSLLASKFVLEALVDLDWPLVVYVLILATLGYGPSVLWCRYVSRHWGSGSLRSDIGLAPRWADLGWGPVIWLAALGAQIVLAAVIVGLGVPVSNNTDGITDLQTDRTYVVSIVITAVIAAPIVEEMVFRGVVLRGLRSATPTVLAIVLQGVLFGCAHADPVRGRGNVGLVLVLSGVGITFGAAAFLLRRIGPTIVAHAIFNGVVLLIVLTGVADRLQDSDASGPGSGREQRAVVDQSHVSEERRGRDAHSIVGMRLEVGHR
ncbi:MAG: type II CAAX endopeptidase family protein [Ilumatobacteraceae bacterium]